MMNSQRTARRVSIGRLSLMWLVLTITLITSIASITVLADLDTTDIPLPRIREAKLDKANLVANQVAKPVEYHIYLDFQNAFTVLKGKISIAIEVVKESSPSVFGKLAERLLSMCDKADNREPRHTGTEIILHLGSQIRLTSVALISAKSRHDFFHDNADEVKIDEILRDMERQMIAIRLEESLPVGSFGYLEFEYEDPSFGSSPVLSSGSLESKMAGDQLKKKDDDSYIYHIVRLQPGRARELLPCFEEPHFRSEIELQITYPGKTRRVIANVGELMGTSYTAPDGTQVAMNRFRRRRPIAINALAFVIQPLVVVVPQQDKNKQELYEFSSLFTRKCVNWLVANGDDFEYPLNELTLTAVPSTKAESPWNVPTGLGIGLIDHKVLLFNQASASDEQMIEAALHIALVVARQLFGNVLVPRTWSDLWITEGLAAYTALKMINDIAPDWRIFSYFRANYLKQALELDSSHELPPISYTPLAGDGAAQATDSKSDASRLFYSSRFELVRLVKGAAIIQMLERQLPTREDDERGISFGFYDVIRSLMEGSRDGLIDMPTLARAFAENRLSGDELVKMIKPWAELSGFPSLQISVDERRPDVIEVKQAPTERLNHLMGRVQDDSLWPTPLEINYHNKLNLLETGQVALLDRLSSGKKSSQSSAMQLSLPSWTRDHSVAIERADDYESIPYYRVTCSGHGMSCRSLFEGAEQFE